MPHKNKRAANKETICHLTDDFPRKAKPAKNNPQSVAITAAMKIQYKLSGDVPSPGTRFPPTQYFVHFKRNIATADHTTVEATLSKSVARLYVRGWLVDVVLTLCPFL